MYKSVEEAICQSLRYRFRNILRMASSTDAYKAYRIYLHMASYVYEYIAFHETSLWLQH